MTETERLAAASKMFKSLSSPLRLAMVSAVYADGPQCVHELVERLGVSQSLVSQHLRVLRAAEVVQGIRRGKDVIYEIADVRVAQMVEHAMSHIDE